MIFVIINGIEINIAGKVCINTKYYDTPIEAFLANYSPDNTFDESLTVDDAEFVQLIKINEWTSVLIANTSNDRLIAASIKEKDNKYVYTGYCSIIETEGFSGDVLDGKIEYSKMECIVDGYKYEGCICYAIVEDEQLNLKDDKVKCIELSDYSLNFLYYLES